MAVACCLSGSLERRDHSVTHGGGRGCRAALALLQEVASEGAGFEHRLDSRLNGRGLSLQLEGVPQHQSSAKNLGHWVSNALACDVGCAPAAWLIHVNRIAEGGRGHQPQRAREHAGGVREDVSEHVLCSDHIKRGWLLDDLHGCVVHVHELQLHVGVLWRHLSCNLPPKARGLQDVGLVDNRDLLAAKASSLEGEDDRLPDALNSVVHHVISPIALPLVLSEVDAAHQLPDDEDVDTCFNNGWLQRTQVRKEGVDLGRAEVVCQVKPLPESEERILLAILPAGLVLLVDGPTDRAEQDGI
mmetsp:Transcript_61347/g.154880  ORF Transcript_61347/g.154880 Transcript_61347/m.154880 type:complete len:301 (+) Transcript_61347:126-1028(+)